MDNSSVNSDLIRGHVTTIILKILHDHDCYGYDIIREVETKSEGSFKIKQPTLYSVLKRLESQGYISSYMGDVSNGGKRRYYTLTEMGRNFLKKDQNEWEYSRTIINRLLSDKEYDLSAPPPFETEELRPYTKRTSDYASYVNAPIEDDADSVKVSAPLIINTAPETFQKPTYTENSLNIAPIADEPLTRASSVNYEAVEVPTVPTPERMEQPLQQTLNSEQKSNQPSSENSAPITPNVELTPFIIPYDNSVLAQKEDLFISPTEPAKPAEKHTYMREDLDEPVKKPQTVDLFPEKDEDESYKNKINLLFSAQEKHELPKKEEVPVRKNSPVNVDELTTRLYAEGYKLIKYNKANSNSYYTMSSYYVNKILMTSGWLSFLIFLVEMAVIYFTLCNVIHIDSVIFTYILAGIAIVPVGLTINYLINPRKRVKAQFELKQSLFNTLTIYLFLVVIVTLIGFFILGKNAVSISALIKPIIMPIVMLLNIPLSSIIFGALYNTHRYHLK